MLRVVEPCVRNPHMLPLFRKFYDVVLLDSEGLKGTRDRVTVNVRREDDIYRVKSYKERGLTVIIKPFVRSLTKRALDVGVDGVQVDSRNVDIFRKGQLNLLRQYDVPVEVDLSGSDFYTVRNVALWSTRFVVDVVLASCSSDPSQFWHHLSKLALLTSLGIEEPDAFHYVYISPLRLLKKK